MKRFLGLLFLSGLALAAPSDQTLTQLVNEDRLGRLAIQLNARKFDLDVTTPAKCLGAEDEFTLRGGCLIKARTLGQRKFRPYLVTVHGGSLFLLNEVQELSEGEEGSLVTYLEDGGGEDFAIDALEKAKLNLKDSIWNGAFRPRCLEAVENRSAGFCLVSAKLANGKNVPLILAIDSSAKFPVQVERLLTKVSRTEEEEALFKAVDQCAGNDSGGVYHFDREATTPADVLSEIRAKDKKLGCSSRRYSKSKEEGAQRFLKALTAIRDVKECVENELSKRQRKDLEALVTNPSNLGVYASEFDPKGSDNSESCMYYNYYIYTRKGLVFQFVFNFTD